MWLFLKASMAGSERGSMEDLRGQIFTVLGIYEVNFSAVEVNNYFCVNLILPTSTCFNNFKQRHMQNTYESMDQGA